MIAALAAVALAVAAGLPLARAVDRAARLRRHLGEAVLFGFGVAAALLLVLSIAGIRWTAAAIAIAMLIVAAAGALVRRPPVTPPDRLRPTWVTRLLDGLTLLVFIAYLRFATAAAPWELDFIDNWGLKAKLFAFAGGIDWSFLQNGWYWWSHPDYPPLVPLSFDFLSLLGGSWNDRWAGLLNVALAAGAVLIARDVAEEALHSPTLAAFFALVVSWFVAIPWIGLADGPLVAMVLPALLLVRQRRFGTSAILLGLGASCKNEGLTFVVAAVVAMLADRDLRGSVWRMWPAAAIPLPWLVLRSLHHLQTDLTSGAVLPRVFEHLRHPSEYTTALLQNMGGRPMLWAGLCVGILLGWRVWGRERFMFVAALVQSLFYLGAYLVTPLDVVFHIRWSWDRLVWHVAAVMTAAILLPLLRVASSRGEVAIDEQNRGAV